jgi:hypothetical protein
LITIPDGLTAIAAEAIRQQRYRYANDHQEACRHDDARVAVLAALRYVADKVNDLLDVDAMEMPDSRRKALRQVLTIVGETRD